MLDMCGTLINSRNTSISLKVGQVFAKVKVKLWGLYCKWPNICGATMENPAKSWAVVCVCVWARSQGAETHWLPVLALADPDKNIWVGFVQRFSRDVRHWGTLCGKWRTTVEPDGCWGRSKTEDSCFSFKLTAERKPRGAGRVWLRMTSFLYNMLIF